MLQRRDRLSFLRLFFVQLLVVVSVVEPESTQARIVRSRVSENRSQQLAVGLRFRLLGFHLSRRYSEHCGQSLYFRISCLEGGIQLQNAIWVLQLLRCLIIFCCVLHNCFSLISKLNLVYTDILRWELLSSLFRSSLVFYTLFKLLIRGPNQSTFLKQFGGRTQGWLLTWAWHWILYRNWDQRITSFVLLGLSGVSFKHLFSLMILTWRDK